MEALESQIAKILLGNNKSSQTYVYVMAEKAPVGEAELYLVAELPLFNPAAEEACERICVAIASTLKRSYRRMPSAESNFENAISQINEELGKLAAMGQTQWIDKLNCIIGVKETADLSIASCGKISAYLLRNGELTDISCSQTKSHPLKTFENFAVGKIRLGDLILLSTSQLFNYVSMDRLLGIFGHMDFLTATQTVIQLLKENAEPQISFGTLLNLQVPEGETPDAEMDLENYVVEKPSGQPNALNKVLSYIKNAFAIGGVSAARIPKVGLPGISFGQKLKNFSGNTKNFFYRLPHWWSSLTGFTKSQAKTVKANANLENFKQLSSTKKIFLASAIILFIAVIANIGVAIHLKKIRTTQSQTLGQLTQIQTLLSNAQSSHLYKDDASASNFLQEAKSKLPNAKTINYTDMTLYNKLVSQMSDLDTQLQKIFKPQVTNLGSLGAGNNLIKLPDYDAIQVNSTIISYQKSTGQIQDNGLKLNLSALANAYLSGNTAAVYDGSNLYLWDFSAGKILGAGYSQNLPAKDDFAGIAQYPVNGRVYVADKKADQIISYLPGRTTFSKPVVAVRDPSLGQAVDITIDTNIYVLTKNGVSKFQAGKLADFSLQSLPTPLSGSGKIYTQKDFSYIYILDAGNNRILIFDKSGNLVNTLLSDSFTNMKDFQADEKNKTIYVLNDGSLLKILLP
jgi:hypothetical protein